MNVKNLRDWLPGSIPFSRPGREAPKVVQPVQPGESFQTRREQWQQATSRLQGMTPESPDYQAAQNEVNELYASLVNDPGYLRAYASLEASGRQLEINAAELASATQALRDLEVLVDHAAGRVIGVLPIMESLRETLRGQVQEFSHAYQGMNFPPFSDGSFVRPDDALTYDGKNVLVTVRKGN